MNQAAPMEPGTRLGPYEIVTPVGAGGMGEVYKARDTRLDRTVAVKVLPAQLAGNPEFRQRLEREARAVSSLNHPHICTLYDVGSQDGVDFLVMEYLEGETLAARLAGGALPLDETLRYAIEIADALALAHRRGIFHRDLKPGNIMLAGPRSRASAKLLDFGLAKLREASSGGGAADQVTAMATKSADLTQKGTILGTLQYMAPEQLEGKETDGRSDIFAFGAVLYEMLTGRKAFAGRSPASVIAAVLTGQPEPIAAAQPGMKSAPTLERVVKKCLAKAPEDRWQGAQDLKSELEWIAEGGATEVGPAAAEPRLGKRERAAWIAATAAALAGALLIGGVHWREKPPEPVVARFLVPTPQRVEVPSADIPAVSPDGKWLAFTGTTEGKRQLWLRRLDSLTAQPAPGTEGAMFPFWSPDSRSIAFSAGGKLKRMDIAGGPQETVTEVGRGAPGTWGREGVIVSSKGLDGPLYRVAAGGGEARVATQLDASQHEVGHGWPSFLPDGRHFLYNAMTADGKTVLYAGSLDGKERKRLLATGSNAAYAGAANGPGYLLFLRGDTLMAQSFDAGRLELSGEAMPVAEQLVMLSTMPVGDFSASENGVLAFRASGATNRSQLTWFDRQGRQQGKAGEAAEYSNPALSPDEKKVAVDIRDPATKTRDIWVMDLERGTSSRFTFDPGDDHNAVWSPDGTKIGFTSERKGQHDLYAQAANGTGEAELLFQSDTRKGLDDWSRDGRFLIFHQMGAKTLGDGWLLPLAGDRKPILAIGSPFNEYQFAISPDSRWIAYTSGESGRREVYVQGVTQTGDAGGKWQISSGGGTDARWRRDGKELFFVAREKTLMAVDVKGDGPSFAAGAPKPLFDVRLVALAVRNRYVVAENGQKFLVNTPLEEAAPAGMTVVMNWAAGLRR